MGLVETEALVLKSYSLSDADKITVFLTREHGLMRGVAKGAKKPGSHFGSSLEPCSIVKLTYFQKEQQELASIRQIELLKSYFQNASEPAFLQSFAYIAELLSEFSPPNEPNERLFRMTKVCLEDAASADSLAPTLTYFELWLLKLCGYLPAWDRCSLCQREIGVEEPASLHQDSALACSACKKPTSGFAIGAGERKVYETAQRVGPDKFREAVAGNGDSVRRISAVLRRLIASVLGRDIHEGKILSAIY